MALSDKNILITPNKGQSAEPKIVFSGADAATAAQNITLSVYPTNSGTISFDGSAGQLFSISNNLSGTIYSVNDISGIPSIEVIDNGLVKLAQYSGNVVIGSGSDNGSKLQVGGDIKTSSTWINGTGGYNGYNENIRLFSGLNGTSTIAFNASGITGEPPSSILGYSDRLEVRVTGQWQTRTFAGNSEAYGSYRAPIFYDSNDTAFYVDPNSTTRLNVLNVDGAITGGAITGANIYTSGWYHNTTNTYGLYNSATSTHFYSDQNGAYNIAGNGSRNALLKFRDNHQSTVRGYVGVDGAGFGLWAASGAWAVRVNDDNTGHLFNSWTVSGSLTVGSGASSDIYMTDTDEGTRRIHCNSNHIGFLNESNLWGAYCDDAGSWHSDFSVRAPIFYDQNDTAYFIDPNSTGAPGTKLRSGILFGPNPSWGAYLYVGGDSRSIYTDNTNTASVCASDGNLHMDASSGHGMYLNFYDGDVVNFGNGAGSVVATVNSSGVFTGNNFVGPGTGLTGTAASLTAGAAQNADRVYPQNSSADGHTPGHGLIPFYQWGGTNTTGSVPTTASYLTGFSVGSNPGDQAYGFQVVQNMWDDDIYTRRRDASIYRDWKKLLNHTNYNSYAPTLTGGGASGTWGINITGNAATVAGLAVATGRNNVGNQIVRTDANGYLQAGYINSLNGWNENNNASPDRIWGSSASDEYLRTYRTSALSVNYANTAGTADNIDGWGFVNTGSNNATNADTIANNGISYYSAGVPNFSGNATDGALYSQVHSGGTWEHQIAGDYRSGQIALRGKNNGTWQSWRTVIDSGNIGSQSVSYANTAGSATDSTKLPLTGGTMSGTATMKRVSWVGVDGDSGNYFSVNHYSMGQDGGSWTHPYPDLIIGFHTGIRIGAQSSYGGTRFYNNSPSTNNSGGEVEIFSIGNGDNNVRVADTIYAAHYRGNANVGGTGEAIHCPAGIYSQGTNWLYGPIYTDSNNIACGSGSVTASQFIGNATRANRANGNFYIDDNYGNSIVGAYNSYKYQGVFAMGDSYKLPADGTTTDNCYGIAWSHPNAGGIAANLNDHGALIINAGGFRAAISGSIRCVTDMRAPIFYDYNDTAFYVDPNSTTRLNVLNVVGNTNCAFLGVSSYIDNYGAYYSYQGDSDFLMRSFNESAGNAQQFYIKHNLGAVEIGNSRGACNLIGNASTAGTAGTAAEATNNEFYIRGNSPTIEFVDNDQSQTRYVHHNGGSIGFLNSGAGWVLRCDDTTTYGTFSGNLSGIASSASSCSGNSATASIAYNLYGNGGDYIASRNSGTGYGSAIQIREAGLSGANGSDMAFAPRLAFHWGGLVASSIAMQASGRIAIMNNPGTGYEDLVAKIITATTFSGNLSGNATSANQLQAFTGDDFTGGGHYVKAIRGSGWDTRLTMCYANGVAQSNSVSVSYADNCNNINGYNNPTTAATANTTVYRGGSGEIYAAAFYYSSDRDLKHDIRPLEATGIDKLRPRSFTWNLDNKPDKGFISQELLEDLPEAHVIGEDGVNGLNLTPIVAELVAEVQKLKKQLQEVMEKLNA